MNCCFPALVRIGAVARDIKKTVEYCSEVFGIGLFLSFVFALENSGAKVSFLRPTQYGFCPNGRCPDGIYGAG